MACQSNKMTSLACWLQSTSTRTWKLFTSRIALTWEFALRPRSSKYASDSASEAKGKFHWIPVLNPRLIHIDCDDDANGIAVIICWLRKNICMLSKLINFICIFFLSIMREYSWELDQIFTILLNILIISKLNQITSNNDLFEI